jgi:hypothetical protein
MDRTYDGAEPDPEEDLEVAGLEAPDSEAVGEEPVAVGVDSPEPVGAVVEALALPDSPEPEAPVLVGRGGVEVSVTPTDAQSC